MHHSKFPLSFYYSLLEVELGSPGGSESNESTCSSRDLGSIPGLGRSLEEGVATLSNSLAWKTRMDRAAWRAAVHGVAESDTTEWLSTAHRSRTILSFLELFLYIASFLSAELHFAVYSFLLWCSRALRHQHRILWVSCVFSLLLMKEKTHLFHSFNFIYPFEANFFIHICHF